MVSVCASGCEFCLSTICEPTGTLSRIHWLCLLSAGIGSMLSGDTGEIKWERISKLMKRAVYQKCLICKVYEYSE